MKKTILVAGATGYLGSKVIKHLSDKDVKIKAFVRPTTNSEQLKNIGVEISTGDLTKPKTIEKALQGVDVVVSTAIGYSNRKKGDSLKSVDDLGNRNLIDAIKKLNISKFVFTSILNADKAKSVPHFWQKKLIEDYMDEQKVPYIALRASGFLDQSPSLDSYAKGLKKGKLKAIGSAKVKWTNILTEDLAEYLATAAVDDNIPLGKMDIGMNEPMNAEMLAEFASEYSGKNIKVSTVPWPIIGTVFSIIGIFKPFMKDLKKMLEYFFTGQFVADTTLQKKYFGFVPTVKDSVFRYCEQINLKTSI